MRAIKTILAAALLLSVTACSHEEEHAAIEAPRTEFQSVVVNTPGVTGVSCVLQSGNNSYSVTAPGAVMVHRAPDIMNVSCFKGNYMRGQASFKPSFAPGEGDAVRGTQSSCLSCNYPSTVTVALSLNKGAMDVPYTILR